MKVLTVFLLAVALAQGARIRNPLNIHNLPDRIVLYKDIVQDPVIRESIRMYELDSRIVGGVEAAPNSVPHQVALNIDAQYFCGGTLISEEWVLTAAHCVDGANEVVVTLGAHNISNQNEATQVKITAASLVIHPIWLPRLIRNDVALIKLGTPVTYNKNMSPACLVRDQVADGIDVTVTGWGKPSDAAAGISPVLRTVDVKTISNAECASTYGAIITSGNICIDTTGGKGSCNGDSGGPLTLTGKIVAGTPNDRQCQVGIVSFGSSAGCEGGLPAGFTRVSSFIDWIIANTEGVEPCDC